MKCCFCCQVWQPRMKWHFLWLKMSGWQKFESHFIVNGATSPSLCQNCQQFCPNLPTDLWSPSCTRLLFHGNVSAVSPMSTPIFVQATKKMVIHQARPWNVLLIPQVLYDSTFNQSLWKTNSAFSWATCAPDSFESISCIWDNTDGRTQEIHHLFSHIHGRFYWWVGCFLKGSLHA